MHYWGVFGLKMALFFFFFCEIYKKKHVLLAFKDIVYILKKLNLGKKTTTPPCETHNIII